MFRTKYLNVDYLYKLRVMIVADEKSKAAIGCEAEETIFLSNDQSV